MEKANAENYEAAISLRHPVRTIKPQRVNQMYLQIRASPIGDPCWSYISVSTEPGKQVKSNLLVSLR
jgi:hypothetical protein